MIQTQSCDDEIQAETLPSACFDSVQLEQADSLTRYSSWPSPTVIVSDGPYGLGIFPGEPPTHETLAEWYEPHIKAWSEYATPETTLWFWCNEIGWATVHPVLARHGWQYRILNVWDKGISHVAGNVNGDTIRQFPVVTEVCVQYVRVAQLQTIEGELLDIKDWLRYEWARTGLPFTKTNEACGVKNAATRKYFTKCHLWYFPPPDKMEELSSYANKHGKKTDRPYFSLDGKTVLTGSQWSRLRSKWNHTHGVTNVWSEPPVRGAERMKDELAKTVHANQKPLTLIERIILASSDPGDIVWEPFGGLCTSAIASLKHQRRCYSAEIIPSYYEMAKLRAEQEHRTLRLF